MALFQKSVLQKHLKGVDEKAVNQAWQQFSAYFHNSDIQENIRSSKEEQFQATFLTELFVKVLGYTLNPQPNFNLTTEFKNIKGAKKADGAVLKEGKAIAVIELKGTNTTDLDKVENQAFGYKNNQPDAVYVITSNFEKLRFYIDNAVEYLEFNLFRLTQEQFTLLWLCLAKESIFSGLPKQIKNSSLIEEENITKQLYKDYSAFKHDVFNSTVELNPKHDKLLLFKKTQKLLDRFLFVFFAEDRLLLPPNSIRLILTQWKELQEKYDEYRPLYSRFQKYFGVLNTGHKGKKHDIFAYNGGLFKADKVLDKIKIDDDVLYRHTQKLSTYDFESEIDVNILGHIFEHSLNEMEEMTAQLEGKTIEKGKTKRKKDGVFYTPKYITKYIVENTVGKLCEEQKETLEIDETEYEKNRKGRKKATLIKLRDKLEAYRNWLLGLTICDPACGSGAFLNQALEFLIQEHRYIDELQTKLLGGSFVFPNVENAILEKNLYGVDINNESVDIAKLSLWLRTARKGRKLTSLSNNIKCGNSLIDDPTVAGEKAFDWQKEFPKVFAKGGFDVVIGNPPYLRVQGLRENFEVESVFYEKNYQSATGRFDIYVLFIEKTYHLTNPNGLVSMILPHKFMVSDFGEGIRKFLVDNKAVDNLLHFEAEMVFKDASTYTCIIGLSKRPKESILFKKIKPENVFQYFNFDDVSYTSLDAEKWSLQTNQIALFFKKINALPLKVKDVFSHVSQGIVSVGDDIFLIEGKITGNLFKGYSNKQNAEIEIEAALVKPLLKGENVKKYSPLNHSYYVIYPHFEENKKTKPFEEDFFEENYPKTYQYLSQFKAELIEKKIRYKTNPKYWYSLHRSREMSVFEQEKIVTPETSLGTNLTLDNNHYYHNTQVYSLIHRKKYSFDIKMLLAIMNSSIFWFFLKSTGAILRGGYFRFKTKYLEPFPLPNPPKDSQPFIDRVDILLEINQQNQSKINRFLRRLQNNLGLKKTSKKIDAFYKYDFKTLVAELKKKKIKLSLTQQDEWEEYFEAYKSEINQLQSQIAQTDNEIDQMVYQLYGLTDAEIAIVEG